MNYAKLIYNILAIKYTILLYMHQENRPGQDSHIKYLREYRPTNNKKKVIKNILAVNLNYKKHISTLKKINLLTC